MSGNNWERTPDEQRTAPDVTAEVRCEAGRWVVYLGVHFWEPDGDANPVTTVWHRIGCHDTQERAEVAAGWIVRGADRCGGVRYG